MSDEKTAGAGVKRGPAAPARTPKNGFREVRSVKTTSMNRPARRLALLLALVAAFVAPMVTAGRAQADVPCGDGLVCMFDGTAWGGYRASFGDYDKYGTWRTVPGAIVDQARSLWNTQTMDKCNNGPDLSIYPWVYFADSGPSGKVGALFYTYETAVGLPWRSLGYYEDRIDVRYNRCNSIAPSYIPRNAF